MKIFGIGRGKTGTTSLHKALELLKIKSVHNNYFLTKIYKLERKLNLKPYSSIPEFDAYHEFPAVDIYKELDEIYPNSKFIFTIRNMKDYLLSKKNHVIRNQKNPIYHWDNLTINIDNWRKNYIKHTKEVKEYFKNKNNLLVMNICDGDGWEKLCPFLNKEIPNIPFPHLHKTLK